MSIGPTTIGKEEIPAPLQPGCLAGDPLSQAAPPGRWRALALLSMAELLGMSLWFSAAAVLPALRSEWSLNESVAGWLTIAVQLGFVCGALLSALLNLPDIIRVRHL